MNFILVPLLVLTVGSILLLKQPVPALLVIIGLILAYGIVT